jgi:hypothetical protein
MNSSHPFGVHLRRARIHRGISLEEIARATKVRIELWEDLESDDFSRWPSGLYARQWIDAYARLVGLDAIETVNEFCRVCPQADRRSEALIRAQADIIGHALTWQDDVPTGGDRRQASARTTNASPTLDIRWLRLAVASTDFIVVAGAAGTASLLLPFRMLTLFAVLSGLYYGLSTAVIGCTPTAWLLETFGRTASKYGRYHDMAFRRLVSKP